MCGRFTLDINERFYPRFKLDKLLFDFPSRYNIAPNQNTVVITRESNKNNAQLMRWGFTPNWVGTNGKSIKIINAKLETILIKNTFKSAVLNRRCIIPASGFYEWKQEKENKQPYYIRPKDTEYFAFAGLYQKFKMNEEDMDTFTIITTTPTKLIKSIHDRMPLILDPELEDIWLNPVLEKETIESLTQYSPKINIDAYKVSKAVNLVANDSRELLQEII